MIENEITIDMIMDYSKEAKIPIKGTCMEVLEAATSGNPEIASEKLLEFAESNLLEKAPRIKWESAKSHRQHSTLISGTVGAINEHLSSQHIS